MQPATRTYLGILLAQAKLSYDCEYAWKWGNRPNIRIRLIWLDQSHRDVTNHAGKGSSFNIERLNLRNLTNVWRLSRSETLFQRLSVIITAVEWASAHHSG